MKTLCLFAFCYCLLVLPVQAQSDHVGGRAAALSNSAVAHADLWSIHHNQAGLAYLENPQVGAFYENRFLLQELSYRGFVGALPIKSGTFGMSVSSFGYEQYRENRYGLGYGMELSPRLAAGIRLNYLQVQLQEPYSSRSVFTGEIGLQAKLTDELTAGAHVNNPTRAKLADFEDERIPTVFRIGAEYRFSDQLILAAETEKDIDRAPVFRAGIEYRPADPFYVRIGAGSNPYSWSFGLGFVFKRFHADLSATNHQVLGTTPQASLHYEFASK